MAASERADAAFSTSKGRREVGLIRFRRLARELQWGNKSMAATSVGGWRLGKRGNFVGSTVIVVIVRFEDGPTVRRSTRKCC
jgi:hypothetical protein